MARFPGPATGEVVVLLSLKDGEVLPRRVVATPGDEVLARNSRRSWEPFQPGGADRPFPGGGSQTMIPG